MRKRLLPLVLLSTSDEFRTRIRGIARERFTAVAAVGWGDVEEQLVRFGASCLCLVDPYHGVGRAAGPARALGALLLRHPSAVVVAALDGRPDWVEHVRTLGTWGVAGVLDPVSDDTDLLVLRCLDRARGRAVRTLLHSELRSGTSGRGRILVDAAIEVMMAGGNGADLARMLHMHRDTLLRWCRAARLPAPRQLMLWLRMLRAAELLDNPGQTVESVALACGYSANSALSRALMLHVGIRPTRLREVGALEAVERWIAGELERRRRYGVDEPRVRAHVG